MNKNGTQKSGFDIPTQSIVKAGDGEGSAVWMKKINKEHGDTAPQKLEKRRERLSSLAALMERGLKQLQMWKKVYLARNQKQQEVQAFKLKSLEKGSAEIPLTEQRLMELQAEREAQSQQYDMLIDQKITNMAMVEGLCLVVDCSSLRETVKSKSGKVGMLRFSSALYTCDAAWEMTKVYNRLRKVFDLLSTTNPLLAGVAEAKEEEDDEGEEGPEYDDEDVVNEDDRKKIKEETEFDL